MAHNAKEIKSLSTANSSKGNPFEDDIITDSLGQWKHPGKITRIPSNNITMQGVDYPVLGIDNLGNQKMMMPGMDYTFPGDYVTEYPQTGGWLDNNEEMRKGGALKRNKTHKNIKTSLNFIMAKNYDVFGPYGKRFYDPNAKFQSGGWLDKYE